MRSTLLLLGLALGLGACDPGTAIRQRDGGGDAAPADTPPPEDVAAPDEAADGEADAGEDRSGPEPADAGSDPGSPDGTSPPPDADPPDTAPPGDDAVGCGGEVHPLEVAERGPPPDVLLVVDRSGSMMMGLNPFNPFARPTKWEIMQEAVRAMVWYYEHNIHFGLSLFPHGSDCDAGIIDVEIAPDNLAAVRAVLDRTFTGGNTPTHTTLENSLAYFRRRPASPSPRYVVLATDGMPNCGGDPPTSETSTGDETLAAIRALHDAGVRTFVIGFNIALAADTGLLDRMADAGGTARPGRPRFYQANSAAELAAALDSIAGGIIPPPCAIDLRSPPLDPRLVRVRFDGEVVPRNVAGGDGWDYEGEGFVRIVFRGEPCERVRAGTVRSIAVEYGCPSPIVY